MQAASVGPIRLIKNLYPPKSQGVTLRLALFFFFFFQTCVLLVFTVLDALRAGTLSQCLPTTRIHKNTLLGSFARFMSFLTVCVCLRVCVSNKSLPELSSQVVFVHFLQEACAATASASALSVVSEGSELFSILPFSLFHPLMTINLHLASLGCINQTG